MGVWVDLFVTGEKAAAITAAGFEALLADLIRYRIVAPPCALVQGEPLAGSSPLALGNFVMSGNHTNARRLEFERESRKRMLERNPEFAPHLPKPGGLLTALHRGSSSSELFAALRDAPLGKHDLCVWFSSLEWENATLREEFEGNDWANGDVVVYALKEPQDLHFEEPEREVRWQVYFSVTGKSVPYEVPEVIEEILQPHFGALDSGTMYS